MEKPVIDRDKLRVAVPALREEDLVCLITRAIDELHLPFTNSRSRGICSSRAPGRGSSGEIRPSCLLGEGAGDGDGRAGEGAGRLPIRRGMTGAVFRRR
jgi:hypothetical protein